MRDTGNGVREGGGLTAAEYLWGMYTGEVEKPELQEGIGNWGLGIRVGVPLMRHEFYMGTLHRRI